MTKEAAEQLIGEYVKTAEALLAQEFGDNYTADTIEKLADTLIGLDQEAAMNTEIAMIRRHAFDDELSKSAGVVKEISKAFKTFGSGLSGSGKLKLQEKYEGLRKNVNPATRKALKSALKAETERVDKTRLYTGLGAAGAVGAAGIGASMSN